MSFLWKPDMVSWFYETKLWPKCRFQTQSANCGIYRIFLLFRFYVKSKLENLGVVNLLFFVISGAMNFVDLVTFNLQKVNRKSEPLNVLKWQILYFKNPQLWFHVKSEWCKNNENSTLCDLEYQILREINFDDSGIGF